MIPGYQKELGESDLLPRDPRDIAWDPEMRGWYNITLAEELKPRPSPFKSGTDATEEQKEFMKGLIDYIDRQQHSSMST